MKKLLTTLSLACTIFAACTQQQPVPAIVNLEIYTDATTGQRIGYGYTVTLDGCNMSDVLEGNKATTGNLEQDVYNSLIYVSAVTGKQIGNVTVNKSIVKQ